MAKEYIAYICVGCKKEFQSEHDWLHHIENCPKHPMSVLRVLIDKLQDKIKDLKKENEELKKEIDG